MPRRGRRAGSARGGQEDGQHRADAAEDDALDRAEPGGGQAGFEAADLVAGADEDVVHGADAAAHVIGREDLHQGVADDDRDVIDRADQHEHEEG